MSLEPGPHYTTAILLNKAEWHQKISTDHGENGRNKQRIMVDVIVFILPERVNPTLLLGVGVNTRNPIDIGHPLYLHLTGVLSSDTPQPFRCTCKERLLVACRAMISQHVVLCDDKCSS